MANENDDGYQLVERIEYIDSKLNIKKVTNRSLQNNENISELVKTWNKMKLENNELKVKLTLTKKPTISVQQEVKQLLLKNN